MAPKQAAYNVKAPKQTVSLTINSDLYTQAKGLGLNASQIAEEAIAVELARRHAERIQAEIRADLEATNAYTAKHGSFAEMVREHYGRDDE
jgi:post-segregation antitoxin (ccd killing protein)